MIIFLLLLQKTTLITLKKKYNIVLQSENASDDGSLSIYCQRNKLHYINIEAQNGQKEHQKKMILETYSLIKNKIK